MSGGGHGGEGGAVVLLTPTRLDADSVGALFIKDLTATRPDIVFTLQWQPAFLMGARAPGILSRLVQAAAARLSWYGAARLRRAIDTPQEALTSIVISRVLTTWEGTVMLTWQEAAATQRAPHVW